MPQLKAGDRVILHSLSSRKDLNGCHGTIKGFEAAKDRYAVQVESAVDEKPLLLKIANLSVSSGGGGGVVGGGSTTAVAKDIDFDALLDGVDFALLPGVLPGVRGRRFVEDELR